MDLKVVLIHSGMGEPSSYDTTGVGPENDAAALARMTPRPDLVVVGHTHREMRDSVIDGVHFVQPKNWALSLSVVHVWFVRDTAASGRWRVATVRGDLIPLATVGEEPRFVQRLADAHERARAWAGEALGTAGPGFAARYGRAEDTPLLDFINEVQRRHAGAQLAATADFDPASGLPDGTIRRRDVAGIYPYENTLVALRISGGQLKDFLEHSASYYRTYAPGQRIVDPAVPGYNFDVVSGASYRIDLTRPVGQRIVGLAVNGRPVAAGDSFTLATNSYRAAGGGGYAMLHGARVVYDRGEDIADLLMDEIRRAGAVQRDGLLHAELGDPAAGGLRGAGGVRSAAPAACPKPTAPCCACSRSRTSTARWRRGYGPGPRAGPVGGAAAIKTWLDSLAKDCGCTSVRLDGGDEMQGTPLSNFEFGRPVIAAFNALGHRRGGDRQPRIRLGRGHAAGPPGRGPLSVRVRQHRRLRRTRARVGRAVDGDHARRRQGRGHRADDAHHARDDPSPQRGRARLRRPGGRGARGAPRRARRGGFRHRAGPRGGGRAIRARAGERSSISRMRSTRRRWISSSPVTRTSGWTRWCTASRSSKRAARAARSPWWTSCAAGSRGRQVRARLETPWADAVTPDRDLAAAVAREERAVDSLTARTVATLRTALGRSGDEYPLGRLLADAYRNIGKADVAIMNNGGIRADLPAGPVSYGALFEVQPFQNRLVRVTVTGAVLREALEHALDGGDTACPRVRARGVVRSHAPRGPAHPEDPPAERPLARPAAQLHDRRAGFPRRRR